MKRRSFPIWLLRDVRAFLDIMLSFWPLIICVINSGTKAMRDSKVSQRVYDRIGLFLAHAEARLDFALWRQAYRRLGWDPRSVAFNLIEPAASQAETHQHIRAYVRAFGDMHAVVDAYVEHLRQQYGLTRRDLSGCPLRRAARATSPALRAEEESTARAFTLTHDGMARRSAAKAAGGSRSSRGPPLPSKFRNTHLAALRSETAPPCPRPIPSPRFPVRYPAHETVHAPLGNRGPAADRKHRHRPDHPETVPQDRLARGAGQGPVL